MMSFPGDVTSANVPQSSAAADPLVIPLTNLSILQTRMDALHEFISDSVNSNTLLGQPQMDMVSSEIASAIHQIIVNGAALLSCTPFLSSSNEIENRNSEENISHNNPDPNPEKMASPNNNSDEGFKEYEIIELDSDELLAEHVHFCEFCGKGFKRNANLRMHMRAHGNQFKNLEALPKPDHGADSIGRRRTRFSCPYAGCNRNKQHKKFKPLKRAICVKNHYKRTHCPKMYPCTRCNNRNFAVMADLKSHLKHCEGTTKSYSCRTRNAKGRSMAAAAAAAAVVVEEEEEINANGNGGGLESDDGIFEGLDEFSSNGNYLFEDSLSFPNSFVNSLGSEIEFF